MNFLKVPYIFMFTTCSLVNIARQGHFMLRQCLDNTRIDSERHHMGDRYDGVDICCGFTIVKNE